MDKYHETATDYVNNKPSAKDLEFLKQAQESQLAGCAQAPQTVGECATSYRPSLREQSEKSYHHHREQADRAMKAADFFHRFPQFEEFIQLIREGVVQI